MDFAKDREELARLEQEEAKAKADYASLGEEIQGLRRELKIAKGEIKLPKGQTIADVNSTWGEDVDDSIKSLLPDEEGKVEEEAVPEDEPTKKSDSSIVEDDSDGVNEKYEQISIFDDFDFDN